MRRRKAKVIRLQMIEFMLAISLKIFSCSTKHADTNQTNIYSQTHIDRNRCVDYRKIWNEDFPKHELSHAAHSVRSQPICGFVGEDKSSVKIGFLHLALHCPARAFRFTLQTVISQRPKLFKHFTSKDRLVQTQKYQKTKLNDVKTKNEAPHITILHCTSYVKSPLHVGRQHTNHR